MWGCRAYIYPTFLILYFVQIRLIVLFQNDPNTRVISIKKQRFLSWCYLRRIYEEIINITSTPKYQTWCLSVQVVIDFREGKLVGLSSTSQNLADSQMFFNRTIQNSQIKIYFSLRKFLPRLMFLKHLNRKKHLL